MLLQKIKMKKQQKITIGNTNIVSHRFPKIKIKNLSKKFQNTLNKAITGKKLTILQTQELLEIHLRAIDFPKIPNLIIFQLIEAYEKRLTEMEINETYENAIEFRDIIISLKEELK